MHVIGEQFDDSHAAKVLDYIETQGKACTVDEISEGTGINRLTIQRTCKDLCEADNAPLQMFHGEAVGRGRPRVYYEVAPIAQALSVRIITLLGSLRIAEAATEENVAEKVGTNIFRVRIELDHLREFGYVHQSHQDNSPNRNSWRLADGVIAPEPARPTLPPSLSLRILQVLGELRPQQRLNVSSLASRLQQRPDAISSALKRLSTRQYVRGSDDEGGYKLGENVIVPEPAEPTAIPTKLSDIRIVPSLKRKTPGN